MTSAVTDNLSLEEYCRETARRAWEASAALATVAGEQKNRWLHRTAELLRERADQIAQANSEDVATAPDYGLTDAQVDRLRLSPERIKQLAAAVEEIARLPDPVGRILEGKIRPNGLEVLKVRVPLGVVFFIYESRPNVTVDAAALCVKSGNAVILRGGKEAKHSNAILAQILQEAAAATEVPPDAIQMVATTDREAVGHFLQLDQYINVTIPRGGAGLIRRVAAEARMPVLKHYDGNCHVYIDSAADLETATRITVNSKCQRLGVCNAAESLLIHADVAAEFLPLIAAALAEHNIEIRGDEATCQLIPSAKPASEEDYATEFLGPVLSCAVVPSLTEAVAHIRRYGSGHTEAIVTSSFEAARRFTAEVDSAAVLVNASTRFNDGGQFGLGAEIGISTDKFHARGPCGLEELTSYKYVVYGSGQIRE